MAKVHGRNCLQGQRGGQVVKSGRRQIKVLCLPTKAMKITAGKCREVVLKANSQGSDPSRQ